MIYGLNNHPDISKSKIKSIKAMICGSSPLAVEGLNKFEELSGAVITEGYGLSETSNVLTCTPFYTKRKIGSVGLLGRMWISRSLTWKRGPKKCLMVNRAN
jgi:long-chain acyl-CoA synthetase